MISIVSYLPLSIPISSSLPPLPLPHLYFSLSPSLSQEEIDMEYRELAEKSGITHWRRVPALNTDERFIADMADMVVSILTDINLFVFCNSFHFWLRDIPGIYRILRYIPESKVERSAKRKQAVVCTNRYPDIL